MSFLKLRPIQASMFIITALASSNQANAAQQETLPVTGHKPVAAPVINNRSPQVGETLTVISNFSDVDQDKEATGTTGTQYRWQVGNKAGSGNYADIPGATGKTYTPVAGDEGKYLKVKVTPRTDKAITDPYEGDPAFTSPVVVNGKVDVTKSTLSVTTVEKNGVITAGKQSDKAPSTKATLSLTIRSTTGRPLTESTVGFTVNPVDPGSDISSINNNHDGTYTAIFTATKAQKYTVIPTINGIKQSKLSADVKTVAAAPDYKTSSIPPCKGLSGTSLKCRLTFRDEFSNPVSGALVQLEAPFSPKVASISSGYTDSKGDVFINVQTFIDSLDTSFRESGVTLIEINGERFARKLNIALSPVVKPFSLVDQSIHSWDELKKGIVLPLNTAVQFAADGHDRLSVGRWKVSSSIIPVDGVAIKASKTTGGWLTGTLTFTDKLLGVTQTSPVITILPVAKITSSMVDNFYYIDLCRRAGYHEALQDSEDKDLEPGIFTRGYFLTGQAYDVPTVMGYNKSGTRYLNKSDGSIIDSWKNPHEFSGAFLCK
ncbi:invasin domain 3-containing protein [Siccibacter turicensis]|uniref:invasin domain 3-containing protein n=1 Tax=Siccibacter turicensis TaxID=357233 RepID=UPI0010226D66|nr:invasin domain 3-containing protein [Siccibacter turicensis]